MKNSQNSLIQIENFQVSVEMGACNGNVYGHPNFPDGDSVYPSKIQSFDSKTETFTTQSGKVYKIRSYCKDGKKETLKKLKQYIKNNFHFNVGKFYL